MRYAFYKCIKIGAFRHLANNNIFGIITIILSGRVYLNGQILWYWYIMLRIVGRMSRKRQVFNVYHLFTLLIFHLTNDDELNKRQNVQIVFSDKVNKKNTIYNQRHYKMYLGSGSDKFTVSASIKSQFKRTSVFVDTSSDSCMRKHLTKIVQEKVLRIIVHGATFM